MPPRQVYGKKKAHIFSSKPFLESPVKIKSDDALEDLTATVSKLQLADTKPCLDRNPRPALGEICDNTRKAVAEIHETDLQIQKSPEYKSDGDEELECCTRQTTSQPPGSRSVSRENSTSNTQDSLSISHLQPLQTVTSPKFLVFSEFDASLSAHFDILKIAEASFSQVFMLSIPKSDCKTPSRTSPEPSVLKLIPLTPPPSLVPERPTKKLSNLLNLCSTPTNVASEVRLLQHLSPVPGFTNFRALHLLRGRPGPSFSAAYKTWNTEQRRKRRDCSHFPDPNKETSYGEDQLWAVVEMQHAGSDLERLIQTPAWHDLGIAAVWDVFWQVVLACGKAETASRWEHRDLHLGNVCVKLNAHKWSGDRRKLGTTGLEATVIDYTISRAEVPSGPGESEVAFIDLDEDQGLFEGDPEVEYQYEIYRYMRSAVFLDGPLADYNERYEKVESSGRTWRGYHPQTNVVWLHFILHQLLANYEYWQETEVEGSPNELDRHSVLTDLNSLLMMEKWQESQVRSAGDLVAMALEKGWLDLEDVVGVAGRRTGGSAKKTRPRTMTSRKRL